MTELTDGLKKELKEEYFLVGRKTFFGGVVGVFVATGLVGFGAAKSAIWTWSEAETISKLEEAEVIADRLRSENWILPNGAIIFLSEAYDCPPPSRRMADIALSTSIQQSGLIGSSRDHAVPGSAPAIGANWPSLIYEVCIYE